MPEAHDTPDTPMKIHDKVCCGDVADACECSAALTKIEPAEFAIMWHYEKELGVHVVPTDDLLEGGVNDISEDCMLEVLEDV